MIGFAVFALLASLGLGGVAAWLAVRYDDDEDLSPWGSAGADTQPWPAPR